MECNGKITEESLGLQKHDKTFHQLPIHMKDENSAKKSIGISTKKIRVAKRGSSLHPLPKSKNGTQPVFVYGTLRHENIVKQAVGTEVPLIKAEAIGEVKQEGEYSTIAHLQGGIVEGEIMNLTPAQIKKVDIWEEKYSRHPVRLKGGAIAWAYSRKPWFNSKGKPTVHHPFSGGPAITQ